SADGEFDEGAIWPVAGSLVQTPAEVATPVSKVDPHPPAARRVARRAVALMGVVGRAVIEREGMLSRASVERAAGMHRKLLGWMSSVGVEPEFEAVEEAVLQSPPGRLAEQDFLNAMWRVEGLAVLAWALGRLQLPRYDELVDIDAVWDSMGFLQTDLVKDM